MWYNESWTRPLYKFADHACMNRSPCCMGRRCGSMDRASASGMIVWSHAWVRVPRLPTDLQKFAKIWCQRCVCARLPPLLPDAGWCSWKHSVPRIGRKMEVPRKEEAHPLHVKEPITFIVKRVWWKPGEIVPLHLYLFQSICTCLFISFLKLKMG